MIVYDDVLKNVVGEFGVYQRVCCFLLALFNVLSAFGAVSPVFIQPDTDHWCRIPESDDLIATCRALNRTTDCVSMVKHLSIPKERYDDGCQISWKFSNCRRYNNISTDFRELLVNNSVTIGCDHGWEYDTSQYISTVIHEFDLVCDRYYLNALMTSLHMAGYMCGNIVFGPLSDKIGRMKVFMIAIILFEVCTLIEALAPNLVVFAVFRFGAAIALHGGFLTSFVLMTEAVGPSKRTYVGVILFLFYSCGYMAFALMGYLIREWRHLLLVISLPGVLFLSYWWIIPESARWLLAVGDIRRAERILKKTARMNRKSIPDDVFPAREVEEDVKKPVDQNDNKSGCKRVRVGDIFRFKTTRKRCLIMFYAGFSIAMAYYGFVLYITNLEGNDYLNVAVAGAVEVPGHFIIMVLAETKLGRRYTYLGVCILTGATVIGSLVTPNCGAIFWVRFALNMIGKSSIAALYSLTFMYTAELVPTSVRSLGVSIMSTFALFGGVLAPQILLARLLWKPLPMIIFAAMPITVGFLVLLQPETKGKKLPQTLEECEQEEKQSPTV